MVILSLKFAVRPNQPRAASDARRKFTQTSAKKLGGQLLVAATCKES
jgi:hypothetical protein